ncbi:MAG: P-loop NTPase [Deltaproteobacteria bacterium]|nr:P-loop NTPase [Deltaproteobacteria bacterium]
MKISICGKGGSGKSTIVTLLARAAQKKGLKVLVVDSDESNSGLFRMLGFEGPPLPLMELLGGKAALKKKMNLPNLFEKTEIRIEDIPSPFIKEKDDLMLISIGKVLQSLEGCACPMGVLSREFLIKLRLNENEIAIVDMEAGIEHFGRGVDEAIDKILISIEPSFESITTAEKIMSLASGMNKKAVAVMNKIPSKKTVKTLAESLKDDLEILGVIPYDPLVFEANLEGFALNKGKAFDEAKKVLEALLRQ